MAAPVKIRLASRAYDGTLPILRGQISIPGFEFDITETEDVPGMFAGMFKGQYDVSEMSLGELIYYTSRSKADFVAIPVFPSRMFRHGFIFAEKHSGINQPVGFKRRRNSAFCAGYRPRRFGCAACWSTNMAFRRKIRNGMSLRCIIGMTTIPARRWSRATAR